MARDINAQPYLTLDRYRQLMNIPLGMFNGIDGYPTDNVTNCDHCWTQWERYMVAQALEDAAGMLATELKYKLGHYYETDLDHPWTDPLLLRWGHVIGGGIQGLTTITPTASNFTVDPATITVNQSDFSGGASEILIVETSTGLEIVPDSITSVGVTYQIEISQAKLIEWDNLDGQIDCIDYDATFAAATWLKLADLTVYREYLDTSSQASIEFGPECNCWYCGTACAGTTYTGCVYVQNEEISRVRVQLADYSAGSWTCNYPTLYGCYHGSKATVYYQAGTTSTPSWEQMIIRLAHTLMLVEPCGCTLFDMMLKRDRRTPSVLTAERINNPFGDSDGAWWAWQRVVSNQQGRAFMM
jgi:hypothetical protein